MTHPPPTPPDEPRASGAGLLARFTPPAATSPAATPPAVPTQAAPAAVPVAVAVAVQAPAQPAATAAPEATDTGALRAPRGESQAQAQAQALAIAQAAATALPRAATDPGPPRGPGPHNGHSPDHAPAWLRSRLRRLRIGSHLASRSALAYVGPSGPGTGLVAGIDYYRRPIAVRLFRPEPTRVTLVGDVWAAQLLVFRAFALGAQVVVISEHAQHWLSFAQHATGRSDRLYAVAPESVIGGSNPRQPLLVIDDRGEAASAATVALGPWQSQITLVRHLDQSAIALLSGCHLAVLQRLPATEASIATHALKLPGRSGQSLQAIPDDALGLVADGVECYVHVAQTDVERSYVGAPTARADAPLATAATLPAPVAPAVAIAPAIAPVVTPPITPAVPPQPTAPPAAATPPVVQPVRVTPPQPAPPVQPPAPATPPPAPTPPVAVPPQWTPLPVELTPPPPAPTPTPALTEQTMPLPTVARPVPPQPTIAPPVPAPGHPTSLPTPYPPPAPVHPAPPGYAPPTGRISNIHIGPLPVTRDGVFVPGRRVEADLEFDDDERPRARQRRGMTAGVGAIVLLALAGWAAGFLLTGNSPTPGPSTGSRPPNLPSPQIVAEAPLPVAEITAAFEGDGIRFSWTYDDELPGDWFQVTRTDVNDQQSVQWFETSYLVEDVDGACIRVVVVRRNGKPGAPEKLCFPE